MHHLPDFLQPVIELGAKTDQPGHSQQLGDSIQVAVYRVGNARVLHLQHQLQAVTAAPGPVDLPQRCSANRLGLYIQLRQTLRAQLVFQHTLDSRPFQRSGLIFQGVERFGDFLGQKMLAVQSHNLANLDHAAL